ncbi:MAG: Uma2 family endonuclease [Lachnospiraceae bacterium]|nr:Uma2 family endonuclease [Lachnospiraceae bacterium]
MLQPDVLVVCDKDKIRRRCVYGAPDFVIEILSDLTAYKDLFVKLWKYINAGVREYWIVDLQQEKVIVHDRTKDDCDGSAMAVIHLFMGWTSRFRCRFLMENVRFISTRSVRQ